MGKHNATSQQKPLLFINQVNNVIQSKQQTYIIKKAQSEHTSKNEHIVNEAETETPEVIVEEPKQTRKKRINEMNIEEKIVHLLKLPTTNNMPRIVCEFNVKENSYKGVVIGLDGDIVSIRTRTRGEQITLHMSEITSINVLGF
ncbi:CotO family spore coat protein [Bacillus sp. PS06]|uniref:CotO family spore coat protein n=1 Tax=Bacillus sp. PS06 TaxID=2764176 RepID=UPI00177F9029|nr:CotO family spore coat protein [Bacillus sp. PS06]MBD8067500.1 hypothetical protein [Bacillus sp. PS06]